MGIVIKIFLFESQGTFNYMKKNAEGNKPFTLNKHVRTRLDQWNQSVYQHGSMVDLRE